MLNLRIAIKKIVRREPGGDGRILSDHRQDGNDEVHRLKVRLKKKKKKYEVPYRTKYYSVFSVLVGESNDGVRLLKE